MIVKERGIDVYITLEAARKNAGYSQKEAAKELNMHYQTLASLERDSTNISLPDMNKLACLYKVPKDMLFFGDKNEFIRLLRNKSEKQPV